jgi:hypothetical protein
LPSPPSYALNRATARGTLEVLSATLEDEVASLGWLSHSSTSLLLAMVALGPLSCGLAPTLVQEEHADRFLQMHRRASAPRLGGRLTCSAATLDADVLRPTSRKKGLALLACCKPALRTTGLTCRA